jgi:hypothetical protein
LIERAETLLRRAGCPKVNALVVAENLEIDQFYEGLGYLRDDVIVFGKRLDPD